MSSIEGTGMGTTGDRIQQSKAELESAREMGDAVAEARALSKLGAAYMENQDLQAAAEAFTDSYDLATRIDDQRGIGWALAGLGLMHSRRGKHENAIGYYLKGIAAAERAADRRTQLALLGNLLAEYAETGDDEQILECHQKQITLGQSAGDNALVFEAARHAGRAANRLELHLDAAGHFALALDTARQMKIESAEAETILELADACERAGQPTRALVAYKEAAALANRRDDRSGEAAALYKLGLLQQELGEVITAFRTLRDVVDLYSQIEDKPRTAESLMTLGRILFDAEDPDQARAAINRARELYTEIDPSMLPTCDLLLSRL